MGANIQTISLIPYLCGEGGKICLDISAIKVESGKPGERTGTFIPDYTGDLLAAGFNAEIRTDFGSFVQSVMLLAQRDYYPSLSNHSPAVTNSYIDKCWLQALRQNDAGETAPGQILFSGQFREGGESLPFAPLFFCNKKGLFFHPPCFRCGRMLLLCHDDELLGEFELPLYSNSLRRYMYCPSCTPLHGGPWYTRTVNGEENSVAKDAGQLIQDFASVQSGTESDTRFPCSDCSLHEDCYGSPTGPFDAIKFFSFYPFYMVISRNVSCSGQGHHDMISDASVALLTDYWFARTIFHSGEKRGEHPVQVETDHVLDSEDLEILNILGKVKKKWERDIKRPLVDKTTPQTGFEEFIYPHTDHSRNRKNDQESDQEKTVIIPSSSSGRDQIPVTDAGNINSAASGDGLEETVVIPPGENSPQWINSDLLGRSSNQVQDMALPADTGDLEKTVRIPVNPVSPPGDVEKRQEATENTGRKDEEQYDDEDDFLTETVVLRPVKRDV